MKCYESAWLAVVYLLLPLTWAYGTTVSIALSYCPAPATNTLESGNGPSASAVPTAPFVLYVSQVKRGAAQYVSSTGGLTSDEIQAQTFTISSTGQLLAGGSVFSTSGLAPNAPFVATSTESTITSIFAVVDNMLTWTNDAFEGGQALFCVSSSSVELVFNGQLPEGCGQVELSVIAATSLTMSTTLSPSGQTDSTSTNPASTSPIVASTTPSISAPGTTSSSENGKSSSTVRQSPSSSGTVSPYPAPTSTGVPNCYDRSPFDGTVNGGYLILCATDLMGYDSITVPGSDLTDCIAACNATNAMAPGSCLAVEYDITSVLNSCLLKYNVGVVSRGDNQFAQAAIVVNQPYSPNIQFSDETPGSSSATTSTTILSSSAIGSSSSSSISASTSVATTSAGVSPSTTPAAIIPTTSTSTTTTALVSSSAATSVTSTSTTSPPVQYLSSTIPSASVTTPHTTTTTLGTTTTSLPVSPQTSSTTLATTMTTASSLVAPTTTFASSCSVTPTASLCPTYNHITVNQGGSCYDVECTATLQGNVLSGNTSTANSLSSCVGFCNLYNLALPYGCVGVNYLNTQQSNNCLLLSSITGLRYSVVVDSGSLIYAGYASYAASGAPTPSSTATSSLLTMPFMYSTTRSTSTSTSTSSSSSSSISISISISTSTTTSITTTTTTTTTSSSPACTTSYGPGPTQGSLCPAYNRQGLSYESYGTTENYEVECGTLFSGAALGGVVAFDLPDCIKSCQYDNVNVAASCVGVSFNESMRSSPPINNCFPLASITGIARGNSVYDSARLLYKSYPCIVDYSSGYNPTATASSIG